MARAFSESASTAGLMDRIYRRQRHVYDLTRKYYLLGRGQLIGALDPPPGGRVLEIGCGTGRNLIIAARRYPLATFFGIDISEHMLATARAHVRRSGLGDRITLAQGDAADFDAAKIFGKADFDRAFFSYSLSMIPAWQEALEQALACLRQDGVLHVVDFGQQEGLPAWFRGALFAWLSRFHVSPRRELPEALATLSARRGRSTQFRSVYRGYAWSGKIGGPTGRTTG